MLAPRPALAIAAGCVAAIALLALGGARFGVSIAVAVVVPGAAAIGVARLHAIDRSELRALAGREVTVRGHVTRRERTSFGVRRMRVRVRSLAVGGSTRRLSELIELRVPGGVPFARPSIGDELTAEGKLVVPVARPGDSFDYPAYLRRAGVHTVLRARGASFTGARRTGLVGSIDSLRRRAEDGVSSGLDPPLAALARGMVLGEDEEIPDRMSDDFKRSGLAHVLAVSGQNVTLLAVLAWFMLGLLHIERRSRLIAVLGLICLYVPLTGAGPSIVRAGAMGAAGTVAALAGRPSSRWYSLLLAAAVTLGLDPRAWQDVGWQLSFAAVAGIFLLSPSLVRALAPLPGPLAQGIALTIAATLATAPLMSLHFGRVSLVSLIANVVALPAIAPVMWLGMLTSAAAQMSLVPAELLNAVDAYLLGFVASVAHSSAALPGAVFELRIRTPLALLGAYAFMGAAGAMFAAPPKARRPVVIALAAISVCAAVGVPHGSASPPGRFTATFLNVGQGDATLFQAPGSAAVLVDSGPPEATIVRSLRAHGVRALDIAVLTHAQRDHEGGLEAVLQAMPVRMLLDGGRGSRDPSHARIVAAARAGGTQVIAGAAG